MAILRTIGKHFGQYIISFILISLFVPSGVKTIMCTIVGALIAISLFASSLSMILGDYGGSICSSISTWSTRVMVILVIIVSVYGIGWNNIIRFFNRS